MVHLRGRGLRRVVERERVRVPPCYGSIDLFADGTFSYDFVDYGWTAREWSDKELKD